MTTQMWVEKYRPTELSDYIFSSVEDKAKIESYIKDQNIPSLLLTGKAGTGKTSLAFLLLKLLKISSDDYMVINASDENSVDVIRDKVLNFVQSMSLNSPFKVVVLEEGDYITLNGQAALRRIIDEYAENARFIITANSRHKLMPAIKSRCIEFIFNALNKDELTERIITIALKEKIKFTPESIEAIVDSCYPDARRIINTLQRNTIDGKLADVASASNDLISDLIGLFNVGSFDKMIKFIKENDIPDWVMIYKALFDNVESTSVFNTTAKIDNALLQIADYLYKSSTIADQEINMLALLIRLKQV